MRLTNSDTFDLINPILQYIPEQLAGEEDLRLVFSVHDGPMAQSDWSVMDMSKQLAEAGLGKLHFLETGDMLTLRTKSGILRLSQLAKNNNESPMAGKYPRPYSLPR